MSFFFLILGLLVGSFISALSFRYPRGISNVTGRSFCPNCRKKISWYDNIPLVSYLILAGRCRNCKKKIAVRYPLIEMATAAGFLIFSPNVYLVIIFSILVLVFVVDLERRIIPDSFVFWAILIAFLLPSAYPLLPRMFAGFFLASLLLFIHLATRGRGMGLGDVKFAVLGGLLLGPKLGLVWLFLAFLTGAIVAIILVLVGKAKLKDQIAFGPFLVISLISTLLWGEKIVQLAGLR